MNIITILAAAAATGTILFFATLGEIFTERSGVMNLGVEGMMLLGAMAGYSVANSMGSPWLGLLVAMLAAGLLALLHAVVTVTFRADQVVSGLSLTFLGTGIALVLGEGLSDVSNITTLPTFTIPGLSDIPLLGPVFFTRQSIMTYIAYILIPLAWFYINRTRPGLHLRAVGEYPAAADALGINVFRQRYIYTILGGMLCGLAGATISLSVAPGWFSEKTTAGLGWIAVGLVIFAQWDPIRGALGAYIFGGLRRLILDLQGPRTLFGLANPFFFNPYLGFFLQMIPYAFTIIILVFGSREAMRKRIGTPAALGEPYVRGERGK